MRLFVLLSRVPYPLDKGDKLRAYHQLKELSKTFELKIVALDDASTSSEHVLHLKREFDIEIVRLSKLKIYLNLITALFSDKPYQIQYFYQRSANRKVKTIIERFKPDHIYCQLVRTAEYVKHIHNVPKTIDYMDAFSKGMDRRVAGSSFIRKMFIRSEASRLLKYENLIFEYFENKTIISEQDRALIYHSERNDIIVVPNGVDFDFFAPRPEMERKYDLVFTGNMNYPPNVDGAIFLVNDILPIILKSKPDCKLLIAGATPAASVSALASDNVTVSGWMDDIRDAYGGSKVFIAPMRIGTGLQNKLLEAMSMEIPCVTTDLANNALHAEPGKSILIGHNAAELANAVIDLIENTEKASNIAVAGREYVVNTYNWQTATKILINIINSSGN